MNQPTTHRDCEHDPGPITTLSRVRDILRNHPPEEGVCRQDILAFRAVGGCV